MNEQKIKSFDSTELHVYSWIPEQVDAVLLISHGMAEHGKRYADFAQYANKHNIAVFAPDQRGHGKTVGDPEKLGFFAKQGGWFKVVEDLKFLVDKLRKDFPDKKIFLMGHSMGSFLSRTFVGSHSADIDGLILSGTAGNAGLLGKVGLVLAKIMTSVKGGQKPCPLMDKLSFGEFNKPFKPNRTKFDWLSRDNQQVDKYVNDPYCGTIFTTSFFVDMLSGMQYILKPNVVSAIRKDLPIYLFAGDMDPVGNFGKGVQEVFEAYQKNGIQHVEIKLYKDARHETLNETNRQQVYEDTINWLKKHF